MTYYYTVDISLPVTVPNEILREAIGRAVERLIQKPKPEPKVTVTVKAAGGSVAADPQYSFQEPRLPRKGRQHPFEGPEVFDDTITGITSQDVMDKVFTAISEDFPFLKGLFDSKREEQEVKRRADIQQPLDEGEWELPGEDHVGED